MRITRTIKIPLNVNKSLFQETIDLYTKAYNLVCKTGFNDSDFNGVSLHNKTYYQTREYLPAQLAISARMKATESLTSIRSLKKNKQKITCPQSKQCSIRYDHRSLTTDFKDNVISILTINGRQKIFIKIRDYYSKYVSWIRRSADLIIRKNKIFLNIVFTKDIEDSVSNNKYVGIDRGIKNIAVTSTNKFYGGKQISKVSKRYEKLRSALQSKETRSSQRHLSRISRKETLFRKDANHCISKSLVSSLKKGTTIIFENLKNIRKSSSKWRKDVKRQVNKWNFYQFEQFVQYKAEANGMFVDYVNASNTSRKCSACGYVSQSNRKTQSVFRCGHCGFSIHADLNASRNIVNRYLKTKCCSDRVEINQPIVPSLC